MALPISRKNVSIVTGARSLDVILTRNGTVIFRDVFPPQDVHIGEGTDFLTRHPCIPRMFRLFEAKGADFTTLYVVGEMQGRIMELHGTYSIRDPARRQIVPNASVPTYAIDIVAARSARLEFGDELIMFSMSTSRVVIAPKPADGKQVNLPFRKTDPVLAPALPSPLAVTQEKVLRLAQSEQRTVVKESYFQTPGPVTVGPREAFRVHSPDVPNRFTLFHYTNGTYYLHFLESWNGQVLLDPAHGARTLHELRMSKKAEHVAVGIYRIRLSPASMGKITIGNTAFMFNFAVPPSDVVMPTDSPT